MTAPLPSKTAQFAVWLSSLPNLVTTVGCLILTVGLLGTFLGQQVEPTIIGAGSTIIAAGLAAGAQRDARSQKPPSEHKDEP